MVDENKVVPDDQQPLSEETRPFTIPKSVQIPLGILFAFIVGLCLYQIWIFLGDPTNQASPKELGFSELLIVSLALLLFVVVPWEKLGFRIKKIGAVEFENALSTQREESDKEVAGLFNRIEALESRIRDLEAGLESSEVDPVTFSRSFSLPESKKDSKKDSKLKHLVSQFLDEYSRWAFSPLRIQNWGGEREGYSVLKEADLDDIKQALRELLLEDKVVTRISKKGNTLYRVR